MRRICACILTVYLLLTVCACAPAQQPPPQEPVPPVIEETAPLEEVVSSTPESELPTQPEPPRIYQPTPSIVPLVNSRRIYSNCVIGEVTFIRAADQSRVKLPPHVFNYAPVRSWEQHNALVAYALTGDEEQDYRMAFMDVDGHIITNFIYESFGEDYIHFPNRYGYVTVMREGRYGLLDLASGEEVIPAGYDGLTPLTGGVLALTGDDYQLLDYKGQAVADYGPDLPDGIYGDDDRWDKDGREYLGADLYRRTRFEPEYSQQVEDSAGNIIIPFGVYGYVLPYGAFIIGRSEENRAPDFDILNLHGELLLHNPLGAVTYEGGLSDAMVVWLDEQICVFLHPDGSIEPILDPPQVERVYFGG